MLHSTLPVTSGYVLSRKAVEARGKKFATHPIGTGPCEFVSWTPKQNVKLKRFAGYKTGFIKPQWNDIVLLPIADDNAAGNASVLTTPSEGFESPLIVTTPALA